VFFLKKGAEHHKIIKNTPRTPPSKAVRDITKDKITSHHHRKQGVRKDKVNMSTYSFSCENLKNQQNDLEAISEIVTFGKI